jgi:hypothetical protein
MAAISAVLGVVGSLVSAAGTMAAGRAQQQAAEYEAQQLEIKGKEERAAAQREGQEHERKKDLTLSTLQARGATSGFSATDPTSLALADEITKYGTYQQQMAMYGGESRQVGLEAQAEGRRMEGRAAVKGAKFAALGTIIGGAGSAFKTMAGAGGGGGTGGGSAFGYG